MKMEYTLIKSRRKTISLEVREDGLIVRAPNRTTRKEADAFVQKHASWVEKQRQKIALRKQQNANVEKLRPEELTALAQKAAEVIPERAGYYARQMGVTYGRITLRCQKTRWGSCSAKKNLNFNILLILTPPEVLDSVVVHELCHLREMNHSARFYELVYRYYPEYDKWNRWLKDNGAAIMARVDRD
ncbi:MAG: M48 family metallopeptidase [Ruminococcus sp.]|nr:M48 family metallopeptidase [Ruminococcus sp.]